MKRINTIVLLVAVGLSISSCSTNEEKDIIIEPTSVVAEETVSFVDAETVVSESLQEELEDSQPVETVVPSQYKDILDIIYDYIVNYGEYRESGQYNEDVIGYGINEVAIGSDTETALEMLCYSLIDLDGNGVDELLIMDNLPERHIIVGLYTIENNEAIHVIDGWSRNAYYLMPDKSIYNIGSGGAAYVVWGYYEYNEGVLGIIERYYTTDYIDGVQSNEALYVYRANSEDIDLSNPSSTGELMGTTRDISVPEIEEYYEFDSVTLMADYS